MYIESISIKNFKTLEDVFIRLKIPNGKDASGLNIFVGENNTGKSAMFEAFHYLRNKSQKIDTIRRNGSGTDKAYVETKLIGKLEEVIEEYADNKTKAFKKCLSTSGELYMKRDFTTEKLSKTLQIGPDGVKYDNPSGIDAQVKKLFQISNIWADTNPEDESKFGSTTICGNLLSEISNALEGNYEKEYSNYIEAYDELFNNSSSGLQKELNDIANETEAILVEQFGNAKLKFKFEKPEPRDHFKKVAILVNDGEETDISQKGHGLQRAVILSLLQVYARKLSQSPKAKISRPHFLFIDEPEAGLHPQAQIKLFNALKEISKYTQVFINTHSENFIHIDLVENVTKYNKTLGRVEIKSGEGFQTNMKAYRKFYLHHHKLFFASNVIFVEGVDDYERFNLFLKKQGHDIEKRMYLLQGCGDSSSFKDLCNHFGIKSSFIFDIDVLAHRNNQSVKNLSNSAWSKIVKLDISTIKKDPTPLFDISLDKNQKVLKSTIIKELESEDIYVLREGAVEQYLDSKGEALTQEKGDELEKIFTKLL